MITRRSFLKLLGLAPAAPVVAKLPSAITPLPPAPILAPAAAVVGETLGFGTCATIGYFAGNFEIVDLTEINGS